MPELTLFDIDAMQSPRIVKWLTNNPTKGSLFDPYELRGELIAADISYLCQNSALMKAYVEGPVSSLEMILLRRHFGVNTAPNGHNAPNARDRIYLGNPYTLMECTTAAIRSRKLGMVPLLNCILPARHVFLNSHYNQTIQESIDPYKSFHVTPHKPEYARVVSYVSAMGNYKEEQLAYGHNVRMAMLDCMRRGEGRKGGKGEGIFY